MPVPVKSSIVRMWFVFALACVVFTAGLAPGSNATAIALVQEPGESLDLAPGVTLATIASEIVQPWSNEIAYGMIVLTFDRVPLPSGVRLTDLVDDPVIQNIYQSHTLVPGPRLFYVDAGEVIIEQEGQQELLASGDDLLLPAGVNFDARNESEGCSTIFILTMNTTGQAGGYSSNVTGPSLSTGEPCPRPARLLEWGSGASMLTADAELFIARMSFDPSGYTYDTGEGVGLIHHPGPVALMVEQGTLAIAERYGRNGSLYATGSTTAFTDHTPYIAEYYPLGNEPGVTGVALLAGFVSPGSGLVVPGNAIRSEGGGFAIAPGPWWSEVKRSIEESPPRFKLELTDYSSTVLFEDAAYYEGGVAQCLTDGIDGVWNDSSVLVTSESNQPVVFVPGNSPARAVASLSFLGTNFEGTPVEYMRHIECLQLGNETAVLRVDAVLPTSDLSAQIQQVEELLSTLVVYS